MATSFSSAIGSASASTTTTKIHHRRMILNGTIDQSHTKDARALIEDAIAADAIPMDVLIASFAEYRDSHGKAIGILRSTSGIISVISSSIFIWMILRSHDRLTTTLHRLLLGLCIADIIYSLSYSTFNATAPSENDYRVWNARGNQDTCDVQGFLVTVGGLGGIFYNVSLNLYFLAVVRYKKSDDFIRAKIEPFLHGLPIAMALSYSIYRLVKKHINVNGVGACISPINSAPHCVGYDVGEIREGFDIPCWRGIDGVWIAAISQMILMFIPVLIIIVSLGMIHSAVRSQEKKLARYGVGALKSNLEQRSTTTKQQCTVEDKPSTSFGGRVRTSLTEFLTSLKSRMWPWRKTNKLVTRSNNVQYQSRAVMHKAFGYSFAWFLSYGFNLIGIIIFSATGSSYLVLIYLAAIFNPLQGIFNLLIFMHPKIMAAKNSKKRGGETISWSRAFSIAFWSRGKEVKNQGTSRSNLRGASNRLRKKTRNEDTVTEKMNTPSTFGRIEKTKRVKNTPHEEEKCEIQVPDNLNPIKTKAMHSAALTATYVQNIVPSSTENSTTRVVNHSAGDMAGMKEVGAADGPISVDTKEHGEMSMENQDVRRTFEDE